MTEQTLFIPENTRIEFRNKNNEPLHQANILIGIQTFSNRKNDIDISPFVSDKEGCINITKAQIIERAYNFISYGLMDYASLESAKPIMRIYYWGNNSIDNYLSYNVRYLIEPQIVSVIFRNIENNTEDFFKKKDTIQNNEREEYLIFKNCFNRSTNILENIILANDTWNEPKKEVFYKVNLPL